jgi:transposase
VGFGGLDVAALPLLRTAPYLRRAIQIAEGQWTGSDYIGAIRYGFNIPAGFFVWLFSHDFFSANLYPLLLSIGEILLIGLIAKQAISLRGGILAALLLATAPLHIHRASVLHSDAPLAFFMTLSFVLFWSALERRNRWLFVAAGLAIGMTYWIKEVAVIFVVVFPLYAALSGRWTWNYAYFAAGAIVMLALNCLLMWRIEGDPLHVFSTISAAVNNNYIGQSKETSPTFYFKYLFVSIQHTWLLGYLAVAGLIAYVGLSRRAGYPIELRERVVAFVKEGHRHRETARHFRVSPKFVNDMVKLRRETGGLAPKRQGNLGRTGKLRGLEGWVRGRLSEQCDLTLDELCIKLDREHAVRVSAVAASGRRLAVQTRHRYLPRNGAVLVEPVWSDVCRGDRKTTR